MESRTVAIGKDEKKFGLLRYVEGEFNEEAMKVDDFIGVRNACVHVRSLTL